MKTNLTWKELMETHTEKRDKMKAPALVAIVVLLHMSAVGAFVFIQGCGTTRTTAPAVEPPPPPAMPANTARTSPVRPTPTFQPPINVPTAPTGIDTAGAKSYTIRSGDSLSKIASRCGVTTREIQELNGITNPNKIRIGQKLILPPYAKVPTGTSSAPPPSTPPVTAPTGPVSASGDSYVIQKGDSLSKIAAKFGVTTAALQSLNGISNPNRIRIGQKLSIPSAGSGATTPPPPVTPETPPIELPGAPTTPEIPAAPDDGMTPAVPGTPEAPAQDEVFTYTIMEGETLETVAKNFAVFKDDILRFNNIDDPASVKPGTKIKIPPMSY